MRFRTLSDEEYIEQIRKGIRVARWLRWMHGLSGLVSTILAIWLIQISLKFLFVPNLPQNQQNLVAAAFVLAVVLGFLVSGLLHKAADSFGSAIFEHRKDRLLVTCWDALHRLMDK